MTTARTWLVAKIKKAFEQYCTPVVYEITVHYQFWQLDLPGSLVSIDVHAFILRNKAKHYNFGNQETKSIGYKIMFCHPDKRTMEAMICTEKLDTAIKICHAAEVEHARAWRDFISHHWRHFLVKVWWQPSQHGSQVNTLSVLTVAVSMNHVSAHHTAKNAAAATRWINLLVVAMLLANTAGVIKVLVILKVTLVLLHMLLI